MQGQQSFTIAATIMFATGIGIPILAALNGGLGRTLGSPAGATAILFAVGLALALLVLAGVAASAGMPDWSRLGAVSVPEFFGAGFMVCYILAITTFGPRIGVGNAIFFVLLGQLVAAAAIDHYGLMGAAQFGLTAKRLAGIALMAGGIWLAKRPV